MDPGNVREALKEAALDVEEGADFLMVKPALAYLDVIRRVHDAHPELPMVAYNVSGEYSMVKAAGERGWLDERVHRARKPHRDQARRRRSDHHLPRPRRGGMA